MDEKRERVRERERECLVVYEREREREREIEECFFDDQIVRDGWTRVKHLSDTFVKQD